MSQIIRPITSFIGMANEQNTLSGQDLNATTAKTLSKQVNRPCILTSLALNTDQRGILTQLQVSSQPIIGTGDGPPVRILSSSGIWAEKALLNLPIMSTSNSLFATATLDAAGDFSIVGGIDQLTPDMQARAERTTVRQELLSILLGTARIATVAAGTSDECKGTLTYPVDGVYMMMVDGPNVTITGDVSITGFTVAGINMLGDSAPSMDASMYALGSRVCSGANLWYIKAERNAAIAVRLLNNTAGALNNLHVGFVRVGDRPAFIQ